MSNLKTSLYALLETLAEAEKITRVTLREISRDALLYVLDSNDIDYINRVIGVCSPVNRLAAIEYFSEFLPWQVEKDKEKKFIRFSKKMKGKKVPQARAKISDWLSVEEHDIWHWSKDKFGKLPSKDLRTPITKAINTALEGQDETDRREASNPLSLMDVVQAIMESDLDMTEMLEGFHKVQIASEEEAAQVMGQKEEAEVKAA